MGIAYHYVSCIEFEKPRPLLQAITGQLKVPILPAPCILIGLHGVAAFSFLDHNYSQSICAMTIVRLPEHSHDLMHLRLACCFLALWGYVMVSKLVISVTQKHAALLCNVRTDEYHCRERRGKLQTGMLGKEGLSS